jgi:hypothetical protein
MSNNKQQTPHGFCETPEQKCTMNYCDENGCQNRKRTLAEPIEMTDNKEQTVMKLYTEKDLIKAIAFGFGVCHKEDRAPFNKEMIEFIKSLEPTTPIELPTDEEIEKIYEGRIGVIRYAFIRGAKWMRNKIQGGEQ